MSPHSFVSSELIRAQGEKNGCQFPRVEVAKSERESKTTALARGLDRKRASVIQTVLSRVFAPRLTTVGVFPVEVEFSSRKFSRVVISHGIAVRQQLCLIR